MRTRARAHTGTHPTRTHAGVHTHLREGKALGGREGPAPGPLGSTAGSAPPLGPQRATSPGGAGCPESSGLRWQERLHPPGRPPRSPRPPRRPEGGAVVPGSCCLAPRGRELGAGAGGARELRERGGGCEQFVNPTGHLRSVERPAPPSPDLARPRPPRAPHPAPDVDDLSPWGLGLSRAPGPELRRCPVPPRELNRFPSPGRAAASHPPRAPLEI